MFKPIGNMRLCDLFVYHSDLGKESRRIQQLQGNTNDIDWTLLEAIDDEQYKVEYAMRAINEVTYAQVLLINGEP